MSNNVERSSSEPQLPETMQDDLKRLSSWRSNDAPRRTRGPSRRVRVLVAAIVTTCTLTGLLTWATTSIGPAPRVSITLASTDYRNHLNVPINGYGDRAIGRLAAIANLGSDHLRDHICLAGAPIELATADDFLSLPLDRRSSVSIVFLSAHGISSASGPVLLPANANSLAESVSVESIIRRMGELPTGQHKVLMIDGVHTRSLPALGVLHNDFARQMCQLDGLIDSIPNLVVVVSSGIDQQSWADPDRGTTAWAASLIDALSGNATDIFNDGWIDLDDVHKWALTSTETWTRQYVSESQKPLLLPSGITGETRSRAIALYAANQPSIDTKTLPPTPRKELVSHWWGRYADHTDRDIHPCIIAPVLWQQFEATLLRLEQFELSGCQDAANTCAKKLTDLDAILSMPTLVDSVACRIGVLNPELAGFDPSKDLIELAKQLEDSLSGYSGDDAKRYWTTVVAKQQNSESIAYLRHWLILSQAKQVGASIRKARSVDREQLAKSAALVDCIRDPLQPSPQIGLILQFLSRDLPQEELADDDALRIARWLDLCLTMESIAGNSDWWSPAVIDWVRDQIVHVDHQRRLAGDLLFGDSVARLRAEQFITAAEQAYRAVKEVANVLTHVETMRYQGKYQLRRLQTMCAAALNAELTGDAIEHTKQVVKLYEMIDEVESILDAAKSDAYVHSDSAIEKLGQTASRFDSQLDGLKSQLNLWQQTTLDQDAPHYPDLITALSIYGGSAENRIAAWGRMNRFIASGAERPDLKVVVDQDSNRATKYAAARGELALAAWPSQVFDQVVPEPRETKIQVQHRLKTFVADPQWWVSLQKAGHEIGRRELMNDQSWHLRGSSIVAIDSAYTRLRARQKSVSRFLDFQADRFFQDGLWSYEQNDTPYYRLVSELLRNDSIALSRGNRHDDAESQLATADGQADPMGVDLTAPEQLNWTTQLQDHVKISVQGRASLAEGFVTLWARPQGSIRLLQPTLDQRTGWAIGSNDKGDSAASLHATNPWMVSVARDSQSAAENSLVEVFGYFRGRKLNRNVALIFNDRPDIEIVNQPKANGGRVAIRSLQKSQSGSGSAVTIVLDCSGSMGAKPGEAYSADTKHAHAVSAVEKILDELPTGTDLSIWAFGQATGPSKTVRQAEQSIRQIQANVPWDRNDTQLRSAVVDSISYPRLEPWNESPLFATILAASSDLKDYDGTRSLVVITDGHDNRIASDPVANPLSLPESKWLEKHFNGTGITVNVIAFRVENKDKKNAREQLSTVERLLPPGKFVEIDQTAELATALRQMINVTPSITMHRMDSRGNHADRIQLAISNPKDTALTWTNQLEAGLYEVAGNTNEKSTLIQVRDGDQLVLADLSSGSKPSSQGRFNLWPVMQHELQWCRQKQAGRWQLGLQPLVSSDASRIEKLLVLWAPSPGDTISVQSPRGLWIEATQQGKPLQVRWQSSSEQPGAAFDISARRVGGDDPEYKVWVSDQRAIPVASLRKGTHFLHSSDIAPAKIQVSGGNVSLLSASIETHPVVDQGGDTKALPCLVLRAEMPSGSIHLLRTEGLFFEGFDEQYYRELGQYTLRLWPVTMEQVDQSLNAIHLISIEDFKRAAEQNGGVVTFEMNTIPQIDGRVTAMVNDRSKP
jgi:hypothetical protein